VNALAEAIRMLGDTELTAGQLAQLRALGRKYAQRSFEGGSPEELRARLRADIREMLTPEQREALGRRE
jgi:Spy/CpxP family protein refolding chaperone